MSRPLPKGDMETISRGGGDPLGYLAIAACLLALLRLLS